VLIHGPNGSGKTSILEALHYACYLKSFKTHLPKEVIQAQAQSFGIGLSILSGTLDTVQVQYSAKKKVVKLNEHTISSYKELNSAYRAVTITEDDLLMIQGAPSLRRQFLDSLVLMLDSSHAALLQKYRAILHNRNALVSRGRADDESYILWTNQLLTVSRLIQHARKEAVMVLEKEAQELFTASFAIPYDGLALTISYEYASPCKEIGDIGTAEQLIERYPHLKEQELRQKRTLFGAHLDDISIQYLGKNCRTYSSRGQQKLVLFLLKMAQLQAMRTQGKEGAVLLVDDFMTDFDEQRARAFLPLMTKLSTQVILTSPLANMTIDLLKKSLPEGSIQSIHLPEAILKIAPQAYEQIDI